MSRELLMLFLVLASVLGGIMGACIWSLRRPDDGTASDHPPATDDSATRAWRPEPVDRHAEAQSRRIVSLVAELQAAEEQQMRLQRDLATLRASRLPGGERIPPSSLDGEDELPVLNRRVSVYSSTDHGRHGHSDQNPLNSGPGSELLGLSLALDSTAEIPVMSEEELAESIDELELEYIGEVSGRPTRDKTNA